MGRTLFYITFSIICSDIISVTKPKPLYLLFPSDGDKFTRQIVSKYDRKTKEITHGLQLLYYFPCKTRIGDYRFVAVNPDKSTTKPISFLSKYVVRDCKWIENYPGTRLNQYDQHSEFGHVYVVEKSLDGQTIRIIEVVPEIGKVDSIKDW